MRLTVTSVNWSQWDAPVSEFFTVREVFKADAVRRSRADLTVKRNVLTLADRLDVLRRQWGPIAISSWFRDVQTNREQGGATGSMHITGLAADCYVLDGNPQDFEDWLDANWKGGIGRGVRSGRGFTHIDLGAYRRWNY